MATDLEHPYLHTVWADDIRHEVGNKVSLMGIYAQDIVVPALPTVLHRLLCHSTLMVPIEQRPKRLIYRLLMDDTVLVEQTTELNDESLPTPPGRPVTRNSFMMVLMMSPLELPAGTCTLCSQMDIDGRVLQGSKLWVTVADTPQLGEPNVATMPQPPA